MTRRAAPLLALVLVAGCRRPAELPVVVDLLEAAPAADFESDAQVALFGSPAGIASELAGLHDAPSPRGSDRSAWAEGTIEIGLRLPDLGPRRAILDLAPFAGLKTQSATTFLNDVPLGAVVLAPVRSRVGLTLPASAQRIGMNRLKLVFTDTAAPVKAYRKRMAAVLYSIAVLRGTEAGANTAGPALSVEGGSLATSLSGSWRFALRLPAEARLRFRPSGVQSGGSGEVAVRDASGARRVVWSGALAGAPGREQDVDLGLDREGLVEIELRSSAGAAWGPVRVVGSGPVDPLQEPPRAVPPDPRADALRRGLQGMNVLYVVLDAAGARHFSSYGYARRTTPEIDRIASEGVVFENARTVASFTLLAMGSTWTSSYPDEHHNGVPYGAPLPKDRLTLAELLGANGIHTAGFVSNGVAGSGFALDRGFAEFDEVFRRFGAYAAAYRRVLPPWLDANRDRRFFAYVHFREPHFAYDPPPPFNTLFGPDTPLDHTIKTRYDWITDVNWGRIKPTPAQLEHLVRLYDGNLASVDHEVGEIRRSLEAAGLWDRTVVIVTADHGDHLYEHGYIGHLDQVYEPALQIPLVVRFPKGVGPSGVRIGAMVDTLDMAPTVADVFGLLGRGGSDRAFSGRSLLPVALGAAGKPAVLSRCAGEQPKYALRAGSLKLVYHTARDSAELYDLAADPDERTDLAATRPLETAYLRQTIRRYVLGLREGPASVSADAQLSDEQRENLKALGYVQ